MIFVERLSARALRDDPPIRRQEERDATDTADHVNAAKRTNDGGRDGLDDDRSSIGQAKRATDKEVVAQVFLFQRKLLAIDADALVLCRPQPHIDAVKEVLQVLQPRLAQRRYVRHLRTTLLAQLLKKKFSMIHTLRLPDRRHVGILPFDVNPILGTSPSL